MIGIFFWICVGSILYTYVGYPVLLAALGLFAKARPAPPDTQSPMVTLLIAAYNEESVITAKLENSIALAYPAGRLQILVAADGSTDKTVLLVESFAHRGVDLVHAPRREGKMRAIEHAMDYARGEIIVFSDANNFYASDFLTRMVAPFADPAVGATVGAKVIAPGDGSLGEADGLYWKYESFIKEQESRLGCCTGVLGEALAIRKNLFDPPPAGIINDDFYIAMRIVQRGFRIVYDPLARSRERVSPNARDEVARRARIVAGRYQAIWLARQLLPWRNPLVVWQVVSHKFLRPLVPLAMIGALAATLCALLPAYSAAHNTWLALASPYSVIFLALQGVFYLCALVGMRVSSNSAVGKLLYLPAFLVQSNWAALIGLGRFLTGKQSPLWERIHRREGMA